MGDNQYPHIQTKADYEQYKKAFAGGVEDFEWGFSIGEWGKSSAHGHEEPHFGYIPCSICYRALGGDRRKVIAWMKGAKQEGFPENEQWEGEACMDCIYYNEYGQLDDQTILDLDTEDTG